MKKSILAFCLCVSIAFAAPRKSPPGQDKPAEIDRIRNCSDDGYTVTWEQCDERGKGNKVIPCTDEIDWVTMSQNDVCVTQQNYDDYFCVDTNIVDYTRYACPTNTKCQDDSSIECVAAVCGDAICELDETCTNCEIDCGECLNFCGNGSCGILEDCLTCPADCGACSTCPATLAEQLSAVDIPISFVPTRIFTDVTQSDNVIVYVNELGESAYLLGFDSSGNRIHDDIFIPESSGLLGFEALDDSYALLLLRTSSAGNGSNSLYFYRVAPDGTVLADTLLMGECTDCAVPSTAGFLLSDGPDYRVYYGYNSGGHQGDRYDRLSNTGVRLETYWSWGLSHSGTERLVANYADGIESFGVSDCYPQNGIYQGRTRVLYTDGARCGSFLYWLGNIVAMPDGYWISFVHTDWLGFHAAGILRTYLDGRANDPIWIDLPFVTPGLAQLVPFEGNLLYAWRPDWNSPDVHLFSRIDALTGEKLSEESLPVVFSNHGLFRSLSNGDVVWAGAYREPILKLFKLSACFD